MKILITGAEVWQRGRVNIAIEDEYITYVGENVPNEAYDRVLFKPGSMILPGLYNCHCHSPMSLFRGYGEDMPLRKWLDDKILPAEEKLTPEYVYIASLFSIAEMIKNGIVSFSDMYFFCDMTAKAVLESGIKANISRSIVSFDENEDVENSDRFIESEMLHKNWHLSGGGRIKIDMSVHAEYTNTEKMCRHVAEYAHLNNIGIQTHVSETSEEHMRCLNERRITPVEFFDKAGVFDVPATAAHCVYVSEKDMEILREKQVTVAHNPVSNLKLASGIMPLAKMLEKGINVTLGTDGPASNNTLDIMKEMYIAILLQKGISKRADIIMADEMIKIASLNGAKAQKRDDCGGIEKGLRADLTVINLDEINNIPMYNPSYAALYSANSSNVNMTMVDGKILYENGEYTTIDIEKLKSDMKRVCARYFD